MCAPYLAFPSWPAPPCSQAALTRGPAPQGPSNGPPTAAFTVECDQLECAFESSSTDVDGAITAYAWDFGDEGSGTAPNPTHAYAAPGGEFTVTLTVTDDGDAEVTATRQVNVSQENTAPVADFSVVCAYLVCGFTDRSTDPDAGDSLVSRAWDFGDGLTSDHPTPFHTYAPPGGRFTVTLSVTDDRGAATTAVKQVDVTEGIAPDRSGTFERETPHSSPHRHSRYVIRQDGTFELQTETGTERAVHTGRWGDRGQLGRLGHRAGRLHPARLR